MLLPLSRFQPLPRPALKGRTLSPTAVVVLLILSMGCSAWAHNFTVTDAHLRFEATRFHLEVICDLDALALGAPQETDNQELFGRFQAMTETERDETIELLVRFLERRLKLTIDGNLARGTFSFPEALKMPTSEPRESWLGTLLVLEGPLNPGANEFQLFASRSLPPLKLTVAAPESVWPEPVLLNQGEKGGPWPIHTWSPPSTLSVIGQYLYLGFTHILPKGLDHILFVLGLFLLCIQFKPLIWQVTAFTLAHTVTLALATYGVVQLPSRPVEILIALSIVYVGLENLKAQEVGWHRIVLVFAFGLLHGLGFAGVLGELGMPQERQIPALIAFNIGVELGQLTVIAIAFIMVGRWRRQDFYRRRIVIPGSLLIAAVGLYWAIERWLG